ncbi:HVO_0234 family beta-propeller protein [Natronorubrum sulfidifaciens]|uniref:HVO-0234-like beta-propeller domain-containing protein n=1 Tax=Natronorubrum sulfidifaciens JCM 14089 TaxID=1230460 RepID=L9W865_9EURY|nr:hypothetical protein [Natronorubrum sulfidifaciens]ELY45679.1 hypothetical protein C495_07860 [Natronorubrum sulfidifaciens JCM 14089]
MHSIEEKRVYGDRAGAIEAYVSSSIGVVRVRVAGDTVGEFGLCDRCTARDIAATERAVAVATDEDVRLLVPSADDDESTADDPAIVETGFGPAVAVGADDAGLLAASPDGGIARLEGELTAADGDWNTLESDGIGTVRAIDRDLIGTDSGVYRVHDGGLDHAGLTAVRDVSAAGVPLAATADGLYKLGNGWMEILEGSFEVVAADPHTDPGRLTRAHAVSGETVYAYSEDGWQVYDRSSEPIVGIGYGETCYAVTERGTFCSATPDDDTGQWRSRTLGIGDVTGLAVSW